MTSTDNQPSTSGDSKLARWVVIAVLSVLLVAACILGYLADRHGVGESAQGPVNAMTTALHAIAAKATAP